MSPSGRQSGHQLSEPDKIEHPTQIVGERRQAEFGPHLLQATGQKRTLIHPLLDRPERVLDGLTTAVENTGALRQPGVHPVQHSFVLKPRYGAKLAAGGPRADLAIVASEFVAVVDLLQSTQKRR